MKNKGIGVSSCVALGAYPILGTEFSDIFDLFNKDKKTDIVLLIGEVGGFFEQHLAEYYTTLKKKKPLISYIAGQHAPEQTYMGNISAIVDTPMKSAEYKNERLKQAGSIIVSSPCSIGDAVFKMLMEYKDE